MPTSIDEFYPFDAGAGAGIATEAQWRAMFRHVLATGPLFGEDDEFLVFGDSTGMQVKVKTGKAWMRGHYGENTSQKTLAVAAAHATLARIDRVVLRADFTNNRIEVDVLTGTAAGSPTAPTLTQSSSMWEVSLATVAVGAAVSTITAGNVTDTRTLVFGGSASPAATVAAYTPVISGTGGPTWTIGNGTAVGSYMQLGDFVYVSAKVTLGSTSTIGTNQLFVSLPVTGADLQEMLLGTLVDVSSGVRYTVQAMVGTTTAGLYTPSGGGPMTLGGVTNASVLSPFATGDTIAFNGVYQAA